jgi:tRNA uridine 5-carbamoylmethylation protein Kti12
MELLISKLTSSSLTITVDAGIKIVPGMVADGYCEIVFSGGDKKRYFKIESITKNHETSCYKADLVYKNRNDKIILDDINYIKEYRYITDTQELNDIRRVASYC